MSIRFVKFVGQEEGLPVEFKLTILITNTIFAQHEARRYIVKLLEVLAKKLKADSSSNILEKHEIN